MTRSKPRKRERAASARPGARRESFNLGRYLPYHLAITADIVSGEVAAILRESTGLSMTEWRVMAVIGSFAPLSTKTVAAYTTINKVRVSRAVSRLVQLGYVRRARDPFDNRLLKLDFSPKGDALFDAISKSTLAWEKGLLAPFSAEEIEFATDLLARIRARVVELAPSQRKLAAASPDEMGGLLPIR